jgi:SAM-dependent methyltransferase
MARSESAHDAITAFNRQMWSSGDWVSDYLESDLKLVEAVLVARHADALAGPVLELGCGAGRVTALLAALSDEVLAIDVNARMVEVCRRAVPNARVELGDLRDLSGHATASVGAVVGAANVLDVLSDRDRVEVLAELRRILRPDGLLLFSTHNRAHLPFARRPGDPMPGEHWSRTVARRALHAPRVPRRLRNQRRTRALEHRAAHYEIVNDGAHDSRLAQYYIARDDQERQLEATGFTLVSCLDREAREVVGGEAAAASPDLHYAARPAG